MSIHTRREQILGVLSSTRMASNSEIAKIVGASRETVRRDLIFLQQSGLIGEERNRTFVIHEQGQVTSFARNDQSSIERRRNAIARLVADRGSFTTQGLAALLGVSATTIRADLSILAADGRVRRRHGGASANRAPTSDQLLVALTQLPFPLSVRKIGDRAIALIERGDLAFLDDSIFSVYIAANLPIAVQADVITNSMRVALILSQRHYGGTIFMLPGGVQGDAVAPDTLFLRSIGDRFLIGKAMIGLHAYSHERGFFADSPGQAEMLSIITGISQSVYLLLESRNAGRNGKYSWSLDPNCRREVEICIDDGLSMEAASVLFPEDLQVVLCGESHVIKSPFSKQYIVGFAALHGRSEFSQLVRHGIEAAAGKHTNIELIVADNKLDRHTTLANIDTFVQNKVDLVIEYQHDYSLASLIGEKLSHFKIPVIAVDIPIPGAVYFGANNYHAGILGGTAAADEVQSRWGGSVDNLIAVMDSAAGPLPENRITGMLEAFLSRVAFEKEKIIHVESGNDPDVVADGLSELFRKLPPGGRTLIFSINSNVTEGVLRAVDAEENRKTILVAGQNVTPRIAQELLRDDSPLIGSVAFFPERYGERIMELAEQLLARKPVSQDNYIEHKWIGRQAIGRPSHRALHSSGAAVQWGKLNAD